MHLHFPHANGSASTFEALSYEMPFGLIFRRAVLWHGGRPHVFREVRELVRDSRELVWRLRFGEESAASGEVEVRGREGLIHHLPYFKTDCSGQFVVANDSLASARMTVHLPEGPVEELGTEVGAVLEMSGERA
jgi:hypothetical protein